jgi:preprotein translocase subunit SecG
MWPAILYISVPLLVVICIFMVLLVLIQKGRGGGLASAFGGGGGNTAFGSKTGDVLTWATSIVFGIFLILSVMANMAADKINQGYKAKINAQQQAAPTTQTSDNPLNAPSSQPVP